MDRSTFETANPILDEIADKVWPNQSTHYELRMQFPFVFLREQLPATPSTTALLSRSDRGARGRAARGR
jgi:hypothetical protein